MLHWSPLEAKLLFFSLVRRLAELCLGLPEFDKIVEYFGQITSLFSLIIPL